MVFEPLPVESSRKTPRSPAAVLLMAATVGIVLDRWNAPPPSVWWCLVLGSVATTVLMRAHPGRQLAALCVAWASLFGLWHHQWWADPPPQEIYHWSTEAGRLMQLSGRVVQPGWTRERAGNDPQTIVLFAAEAVVTGDGSRIPTSGRLRVQINEPQVMAWAGDRWQLTGQLVRPPVAGNPGGFNYRQWLRTQGIQAVFQVPDEQAITRLSSTVGFWDQLVNWRQRLRQRATDALQQSLDAPTAAVCEALLLGTRSQLPDDIRDGLIKSGLLHVLAISGVNVAVIWLGLMRLCRFCSLSLRTSHAIVIGGLICYAWLTDANPPIMRAVSFACVWQLAELSGRRVSALQAMSLAALVVMIRNPTDLFNPAAWLSFLSVAVLARVNQFCNQPSQIAETDDTADDLWSDGWRHWLPRELWRVNLSTAAVWCVTAPLVAARYHLVSFAGWGLNVLLSPLILVMLWLGYLWLMVLAVAPPLAELLLWPFAGLVQALLWSRRCCGPRTTSASGPWGTTTSSVHRTGG
ncbi:DUF4131 domain-containing protein [bacterium]|nr:DUF4131 domain-containing protein [bacterium]